MKNKLIQTIAAFLALLPSAYTQTKIKTAEKKYKLFEFYQMVLEAAEDLGIDIENRELTEEDLDMILEELRREGIDVKKVDIKESLLATQGVTD